MLNKTVSYVREYFFPSGCGSCGSSLLDGESAYYGLCSKCKDFFRRSLAQRRYTKCGVYALFPYSGKFKAMLRAYKFGNSLAIGNFFAECLVFAGQELLANKLATEAAWVPVPPRPGKIKRQGWDQIDYLARLLNRKHMLVSKCLKRLPSQSQKELNREQRKTNLDKRILCTKKPPKIALLFDDVVTTGATVNACTKALTDGGSEEVYAVSLFYD